MAVLASFSQDAFRFYEDDAGGETAAVAIAAQNTNITRNPSTNPTLTLRLRIQEIIGSPGAATDDWQLQRSINGGSYADITGLSDVQPLASANLTDQGATTNRLTGGSGSFVPGLVSEDCLADNLQVTASNFTEFLFSLQLLPAGLANGDTLDFRLLWNGTTFTYTVVPRITISISSGGGGGGFPPLPPEPPTSSSDTPPKRKCSSKIKVVDKTGRLPKNPKNWPEELKRAIADCCCCADDSSSSSSSSTVTKHSLPCCPGKQVGSLCVTITGSDIFAGTHRMDYRENELVKNTANLFSCNTTDEIRQNGWFGDWFTLPCPGSGGIQWRLAIFDNAINGNNCTPGYTGRLTQPCLSGGGSVTEYFGAFPYDGTQPSGFFRNPTQPPIIQCNPFVFIRNGNIINCQGTTTPSTLIMTEC